MSVSIDINCDLGEGCGNDAELMRCISSANIACGFHAGDEETMRRTVDLALEYSVAIGAHPSFPDRDNFGRTEMTLPREQIFEIVSEQVKALMDICETKGTRIRHVKPHGALYNMAARDRELSHTVAEAVANIDKTLVFVGVAGSTMLEEASAVGLRTASEVFADRTYQQDGSLTPRSRADALITDLQVCEEHVLQMVQTHTVTATNGTVFPIKPDTVCIHGDGAHAVRFASMIRSSLENAGIEIKRPFT
jgi:UPF0271 protein